MNISINSVEMKDMSRRVTILVGNTGNVVLVATETRRDIKTYLK